MNVNQSYIVVNHSRCILVTMSCVSCSTLLLLLLLLNTAATASSHVGIGLGDIIGIDGTGVNSDGVSDIRIGAFGDDGGDGARLSSLLVLLLKITVTASFHVGTCVTYLVCAGHGVGVSGRSAGSDITGKNLKNVNFKIYKNKNFKNN